MDDREVAPDAALAQVPVRPLELLLLRVVQVGHAAGEVDEVRAWRERARREDAQLRLARLVRVPLRVRNLDRPRGVVQREIPRSMSTTINMSGMKHTSQNKREHTSRKR